MFQPKLRLDYFLTREVIGDDAFTSEIEPPVPYTLGVRILNTGAGIAKHIAIESAQPRIVENKQGLPIGFDIISSYVGNQPAEPTLLLGFGDLAVNTAKVGRWQMETNLSGIFDRFSASFTHADELGSKRIGHPRFDIDQACRVIILTTSRSTLCGGLRMTRPRSQLVS
ncbi:hypothetical protein [Zooshikella harenae]|uniref:Uncharacterized protein n=1 Tax=Zooshikella harenae TaxID=2827238 RepID=A0ABS5ZJ89_9GAMM|nr:hypothetical protein [Zooshikella harenae]MBU2714142.1 hypothetical protein [Zooshikella harenae]